MGRKNGIRMVSPVPQWLIEHRDRGMKYTFGIREVIRALRWAGRLTPHGRPQHAGFTAEAVTGRVPIQIAEFAEQSFGDWNGGKWQDLPREEMNAFWTNYAEQKAPAGESFRELTERVHPKILQMSADYRDQDLVVVAHAGTIRAALALALEIPLNAALNMAISNLSLTRIDAFPDENPYAWRVDGANLPAA